MAVKNQSNATPGRRWRALLGAASRLVARPLGWQQDTIYLMPMFPSSLSTWAVGLGLLAAALNCSVIACNIPVFRYALERWEPDPYVLIVFHNQPLNLEQRAMVQGLTKARNGTSPNLLVREIDVSQSMPGLFQELWRAQTNPPLPWVVVRYPAQTGLSMPVWTGPLDPALASALVDSPARRALVQRLLAGESAVWLLVESGNKAVDDVLAQALDNESRHLASSLALPERGPADPPIELDLPLRIAFSTVRIARRDFAERFLLAQLLNWEPRLKAMTNALLFPVYGRGRVLPPAPVKDLSHVPVIGSMGRLLTGPCSCQIKEMNAGFDLLIAANWELPATSAPFAETDNRPPLMGLSGFTHPPGESSVGRSAEPHPVRAVVTAPRLKMHNHLVRNLTALLMLAVVFIAGGTILIKRRRGVPQ